MKNFTYTLKFRAVNKDTFEMIKDGRKKVETRAATVKYKNMMAGDTVIIQCGKQKFSKKIKRVKKFKDIQSMLKTYKVKDINPTCKDIKELTMMYYSFPGYKQKIFKYGLIALELK